MRILNVFAVLCTVLLTTGLFAQSLRPAQLIEAVENQAGFEEQHDLFLLNKSAAGIPELDEAGADYEVFTLDATALTAIQKSTPAALELTMPGDLGSVKLVRTDIFAPGFRVTRSSDNGYAKAGLGLHYRGVLASDKNSIVAISIFDGEVAGIVSDPSGNYVLGKLKGGKTNDHVFFNDADLPNADLGECATEDSLLPYSAKDLAPLDVHAKDANNCVNVYMEVDYSITQQRGGVAGATSFITAMFNQVAVLYANDNININMSELFVWDTQDPYNSTSSSGNLTAFRSNRTSFNGDVAHLVSFQASGGVAYVNVICNGNYGYGFSSINNGFANVPTYSWTVNVVAHELGHNFGSQHTHACVWNGNNTAIDGCYATEGGCASAVGLPSGGGTVMSYCHLTSAGVNLNNGFGPQPGNLIRNRVYNNACLSACSTTGGGGGGGGGGGTQCTDTQGSITIVTDNYPAETNWTITADNGGVIASGGGYTQRNTSYTEDLCLPDGCYTFSITDSYGDGICCAYGNGSFTINVDGTDVVTGGQFGSSLTDNFCVTSGGSGGGGGGPDPCAAMDFSEYVPGTYGGSQDRGLVETDGPNSMVLMNNAWKSVAINYTVTASTNIRFDFGSTIEPEIAGIGFDNNAGISSNRTFKVHGTQGWGIRAFDNYDTPGAYKSYTIPVGQYYTGTFNRLFFVADHDATPRNGNAFFRNVYIYEGSTCVALLTADGELIEPRTAALVADAKLSIFPNPANDVLNLDVTTATAGNGLVRVIDVTGRTVIRNAQRFAAGEQRLTLATGNLTPGTYFVRTEYADGSSSTAKVTIAR